MNKTTASIQNTQLQIGRLQIGKPHLFYEYMLNLWVCGDTKDYLCDVIMVGSKVTTAPTPKEAYEKWVKVYGEYQGKCE